MYNQYSHLQNFSNASTATTAVGQNTGKGSSTIILNQTNLLASDKNNATLVYNFPSTISFPNHKIAVQSITMYYSWANISASLGNNTFTYNWTVGVTLTTYTITIPDGLYEIKDLNSLLQFTMVKNGHYLINSAGQNVYYAEFLVNVNKYSIDINTFPVPTSLPATYTAPVANAAAGYAAWVGYPTTTFNPIITLPSAINSIFGYTAGYATTSSGAGLNLTFSSSTSPQVQPNPTLFLSCNYVNNVYSNPNTIIYSLTPNVAIGQQIIEKPYEFNWNTITGTTSQLTFTFRGNNQSLIKIIDPNMTVVLAIKENGSN
jgi:hypothetical protein